jgi:hypothetical protein
MTTQRGGRRVELAFAGGVQRVTMPVCEHKTITVTKFWR